MKQLAGVLHFANTRILIQLPNSKNFVWFVNHMGQDLAMMFTANRLNFPDIQTPTDAEALPSVLKISN
ncbi:MAG: hypothetical protein IPK04_11415 [Bdellovibrionales bacterium]|nr:hypothetical protein [Bdellovibrionales bacterium]